MVAWGMRRLARRLLYTVVAALLGVLLLEGAARALVAAGFLWFVPADVRSYVTDNRLVYDPALGWRPASIPAHPRTDELGLGRRDLPATPPPGRLRGFAFGDSQTQGGGVQPAESWPAVSEDLLRADGLDVELVNAGAPGYRSAQVLELIESRVLAWHPDFFLVDCRTGDSPALRRDRDPTRDAVAAFLFESRLYRLLRLGVATLRDEDVGLPHPEPIVQPKGPDQEGEGNHDAIAALARARGIDLWFVNYPMQDPRGIQRGLQPGRTPEGARVIDLVTPFQASGLPVGALFLDMNHMTVEGNRRAAAVVVAAIEPRLRERAAQ